ncbi:MAG: corrinoid protein [Dehalococcoidales bacterium]|nr:corrinoid protein [Dehalococcoidales bacterium]
MTEDLLVKIKENVIQGRKTKDDMGIDESLSGTPGVLELTESAISDSVSPDSIIIEALTPGMEIVGEKYSKKEYFIPDMLASADAVGAAMDVLKPLLEKSNVETKGKFVIATVKGDIHDIGKNIVAILLKGAGYQVIDIGTDASEDKIVDVIRQENPEYLGLSALLTTTMKEMDTIIKALKENKLRDKVKVLIGGAAVSDEYAREIGADAFCADGFEAIKVLEKCQAA